VPGNALSYFERAVIFQKISDAGAWKGNAAKRRRPDKWS
jgi:hypothetical protein